MAFTFWGIVFAKFIDFRVRFQTSMAHPCCPPMLPPAGVSIPFLIYHLKEQTYMAIFVSIGRQFHSMVPRKDKLSLPKVVEFEVTSTDTLILLYHYCPFRGKYPTKKMGFVNTALLSSL